MLTNDMIFEAEKLRTLGRYADAYASVISVLDYQPRQIMERNANDQTRFLMMLRIAFGSAFSMMKRQRDGQLFLNWLSVCVGILRTYYANGDIVTIAQRTHADIVGNPYAFHDEMNRDMWRYQIFFARLTESEDDFIAALISGAVIVDTMTDQGTRWLTIFESELLNSEQNRNLDGKIIYAYHTCIEISKGRKQWERVATVSARYIIACMKYGQKMSGLWELPRYIQAVIKQPNTFTILFREIVKQNTEKRFIEARQRDKQGTNWGVYRL